MKEEFKHDFEEWRRICAAAEVISEGKGMLENTMKRSFRKDARFSGEIGRKAKQAHVEVHGTCLRRTEQRRRTSSMTGYGSGPCGGARVEETARRNCKDVGNVGEPRGDKSLVIL